MRIFVQPQNLLLLNLYPWYKNSQNSIYWKFLPRFIQMLKFRFHIADKLRAQADSCRNLLSMSDAIRILKWDASSQFLLHVESILRVFKLRLPSRDRPRAYLSEIPESIRNTMQKTVFQYLVPVLRDIYTNDNQLHWFQMTFLKSWTQG